MLLTALTYMCVLQSQHIPPPWIKLPGITAVLDQEDGSGVAAVVGSTVTLYSGEGKQGRTFHVPAGCKPLSVSKNKLLVCNMKTTQSVGVWSRPPRTPHCQFGTEVVVDSSITVYADRGTFSFTRADNWSSVAVSPSGKKIAVLTRPSQTHCLRTYAFNGEIWSQEGKELSPSIDQVGFVGPMPRFNDMRFIDESWLVFVGDVWSPKGFTQESINDINAKLQDRIVEPLEQSRNPRNCYLFAFNSKTGVTRVIKRFTIMGTTEFGPYRSERISVSGNKDWIYFVRDGGISRIRVRDVAR